MIYASVALYGLLVLIVFLFWRKTRGLSFDGLLERSAHEHHDVKTVTVKHPRGGTWRQHRQWMEQAKVKPRTRVRSKQST